MDNTYKIIRILNDMEIVINGGHDNDLQEGDLLEIFVVGEEIIDPDTSESLGTLDIIKGKVEIKTLYPKMALCKSAEFIKVKESSPLEQMTKTFAFYTSKEVEKRVPLNVDLTQAQQLKKVDKLIKVGDLIRPCL